MPALPRHSSLQTTTHERAVVHARRVAGGRRPTGSNTARAPRAARARCPAAGSRRHRRLRPRPSSSRNRPASGRDRAPVRTGAHSSCPPRRCRARARRTTPARPCAAVEARDEPVVRHQVDQRAVAEPVAEARLLSAYGAFDIDSIPPGDRDRRRRRRGSSSRRSRPRGSRRADLVDRVRRRLERMPAPIAACRAGAGAPPAAPGP
jgi:hypothetical protein